MNEIIYFELNNWMPGTEYPNVEPFKTWCGNDETLYFDSSRWCIENKLVVTRGIVDMSINWCIAATKEWVESNCPDLLTKYTEFLRPDKESSFEQPFLEYSEENIGIHLCELNFSTGEWEFYTREELQKEDWIEWLKKQDDVVCNDILSTCTEIQPEDTILSGDKIYDV